MPPSSIRYDDEALIAEPLHNTFYVTDMVDYTVINDDKTHHHDNLKQLDCCLVQMKSLYLIKIQHVIQDNALIQNI